MTGGSLRQIMMGVAVPWAELGMYLFLAAAGLGGLLFYLRHLHEPQPEVAQTGSLRTLHPAGR